MTYSTIKLLSLLAIIVALSGCCNYYDGFGWQPCAGYTHNLKDKP